MAGTVKCVTLVLGSKSNGCRGYKWILALLEFKRLVKE